VDTSTQNLPESSALRPVLAIWLCALLAALLLYGLTMAPGEVWQDSGDAQVRVALDDWRGSFHLARSHALFFILASGLRHGCNADPAWSGNLLSVITGALTVANLAALLSLLLRRWVGVLAATTMLALSHTLWQFSTMTETYALVSALLSAQILLLTIFDRTRRGWLICMVGLLNGLAASNHNLALLTLGCYVVVALITFAKWRRLYWRHVLIAALLWLIGYAPMLALILADRRAGVGFGALVSSLLVGGHAHRVFNVSFGIGDALRLAAMFVLNFPTPLLLAAFLGWSGLSGRCGRRLRLTFTLLLGAHFLFAARYNITDQFSFLVPSYVILTVFLGGGIDWLLHRCRADRRRALTVIVVLAACLSPIVYGILPALARRLPAAAVPVPQRPVPYRDPYKWFLQPWRANYDGAHRFAVEALQLLPPNAFVLTDTTLRGPLLYLQNTAGLRQDVRIGEARWQPFHEPFQPNPDELRQMVRERRLFSLAGEARYMGGNKWIPTEFRFQPVGPIYQVVPRQ